MKKQILKGKLGKILGCECKADLEKILNSATESLTKSKVKSYNNKNNI